MKFDICIVVHGDVMYNSRVLAEARSLAAHGWRVLMLSIMLGADTDLPERQDVDGVTLWRVMPRVFGQRSGLKTTGKLIQLVLALPLVVWRMRRSGAQVFHAVAFTGLLIVALAGIWRRPVVYDTMELFFDRPFDGMPGWILAVLKTLRPLEVLLMRHAAAVLAVSQGQADVLAQRHQIAAPVLIRSAVDLRRLGPQAADFPAGDYRIVAHSGNMVEGRHLPELVSALPHLPADIVLVLMGSGVLQADLIAQAESLGVRERLFIVPPVPSVSIAPTLAQADVAAVIIASEPLNRLIALPNKFFEAVAAGLPLLTSRNPELERLVSAYQMGLSCDPTDPADIAAKLMMIFEPEALARYRDHAVAARDDLNWEAEEATLIALYTRLLEEPK